MRELKFRVWNAEKKSWCNFFYLNVIDWQASGNDKTKYIFQQYAGLKDQNENDIYEGDIVRAYRDKTVLDVGVVTWFGHLFRYEIAFKNGESEGLRVENLRYGVIGNALENPELL